MGIGTSIFLVALGAILAFAVDIHTEGFNLNTIGVILMIVGGVGMVLSMFFWSSWGGLHRGVVMGAPQTRQTTVVEEHV